MKTDWTDMTTIEEKIKESRLVQGISIRELARRCECSPTTIQLVERGSDPRVSTLDKILCELGIEHSIGLTP